MTIHVTVKNNEGVNGRMIKVSTVDRQRTQPHPAELFAGDIAPGESRDFCIHAARHLIVEEVP